MQIDQQVFKAGYVIAGRYEVVSCLGAGTSGTVYACRDRELANLRVAMKVFPAHVLEDRVTCARLQREMLLLNSINHDNVARFYDCINQPGLVAYTMEYIEGQNLASTLEKQGQLSFEAVFHVLTQLAAALRSLHTIGITHRDLKPANILMASSGLVKVTDFGLARQSSTEQHNLERMRQELAKQNDISEDTLRGSAVGTLDYMCPEYLETGSLDSRSDLYSVGVIAFEMLTGRLPYQEESIPRLIMAKVNRDAPNVGELRENCPPELAIIINSLLQRKPDKRLESAEELSVQLKVARSDWLRAKGVVAGGSERGSDTMIISDMALREARDRAMNSRNHQGAQAQQQVEDLGVLKMLLQRVSRFTELVFRYPIVWIALFLLAYVLYDPRLSRQLYRMLHIKVHYDYDE